MRKTAPFLLALAAGFALLTGFGGGCGHHRPDPARVDRMVAAHLDDALDDLGASDAQRAQVREIKDRLLAEGRALAAGQQQARRGLLALWDADRPDAASAYAIIDARIEALRTFAHQAADEAIKLHDTLTPEQRAKVSKRIHRHLDEP
jgi:periplasmic protein CpxP/Spy